MRLATTSYWAAYEHFLANRTYSDLTKQYVGYISTGATALADEMITTVLSGTNLPQETSEWNNLPIMRRQDLQRMSRTLQPQPRRHTLVKTGGSTGEPVAVSYSPADLRSKRARSIASRELMGWTPGMPLFGAWGSSIDVSTGLLELTKSKLSRIQVDGGFTYGPERWQSLYERITRQKKAALYGYTSLLVDFSKWCNEHAQPPQNITTVWNGAEPLDAASRNIIRNGLGVDPFDMYGARETGALAVEIKGIGLVPLGPHIVVEVVNDRGTLVEEGQSGRLLISIIGKQATQLIRYENGDLAIAGQRGRYGHSYLRAIAGRDSDSIPLSDGTTVNPGMFPHTIKDFDFIEHAQLRVNFRDQEAEVLVVSYSRDDLNTLCEALSRELPGYSVRAKEVDRIPRTSHGKLRQVIVT